MLKRKVIDNRRFPAVVLARSNDRPPSRKIGPRGHWQRSVVLHPNYAIMRKSGECRCGYKAETGHSTTLVQPKGPSIPVVLFRRHSFYKYRKLKSISHHRNNFSLPSSVVERVTSNDEVVSSILAEGIVFAERPLLAH